MSDVSYKPGKILYWEPVTPAKTINYGYDEKALLALEHLYGPFPITLRREDMKTLDALMTAGGGRPLDDIIEAIHSAGEIRIWWDSVKKPFPTVHRERID